MSVCTGETFVILYSKKFIYAYGDNSFGQLGTKSEVNEDIPVSVYTDGILKGRMFERVFCGHEHVVTLLGKENFFCTISNCS